MNQRIIIFALVILVVLALVYLQDNNKCNNAGNMNNSNAGDTNSIKACVGCGSGGNSSGIHKHKITHVDVYSTPNNYPSNPSCSNGYYSPLFNTVVNDRCAGCFGAATQPTGSISDGTLPLFYNHSINSMSEVSPDARNQRWYGPHSGYLN